jgi:hypothetical protein
MFMASSFVTLLHDRSRQREKVDRLIRSSEQRPLEAPVLPRWYHS